VRQVRPARDFSVILMLTAVVGALAHLIATLLDLGRAVGWWH
jgi:hypothetical protein